MKSRILFLITVVMAAALLLLAGCGSGSESGGGEKKEPEPFTLGGYTYKLERIGKTSGGYEASLLIEGDSAPVMITNGMTRAGVEMMLASGDKTFNYNEVSFAVLADDEKEGEFGARASFSYSVPEDADTPDKAIVTDASSGDSTEIDLSGFTIEE